MRSAKPIKYSFIPEDLSNLEHEGFCVIDNLVGVNGKSIKKVTREWFNKHIYDLNCYQSPLDEGLDAENCPTHVSDASGKLKKMFNLKYGITPFELERICMELDISVYAFDITSKCFSKYVSKSKNYPPLVYYCVNGHMGLINKYAVNDNGDNCVQSLIKQARGIDVNIKSSLIDEDETPKDASNNMYDKLDIYEDVDVKDLDNYDNCIIIYNATSLTDVLEDLIRVHNFIPGKRHLKYKQLACVKIHYTNNNKNIF
jgi:hypothetical protein